MENNNNNKKSLKTIRKLREELAGLMMEKDINKITVNELTKRADIHRTTFYSHFQDIYDLYETAASDIMNELDELLLQGHQDGNKELFMKSLEYIKSNPKVCKMIFSTKTAGDLKQKFDDFVENLCKEAWADMIKVEHDSKKFEYLFKYHIHGCMAVIEKWVEDDFGESEKFIIKILSQIEMNARNFISSEVSRKK
ncbi:MAG: TetR/AcrR family transcriptional regulator [Ruminococcus bromii]|nr:TetR/AcrR family transcriptional regulator [Ruminococcus bromii]